MPTPKKPGASGRNSYNALPKWLKDSKFKKDTPIKKTKMMGTNADSSNAANLMDYDYGKGGAWKNPSGTQVGHSYQEDSTISPMKSTGDTAPYSNAVHVHLYGNREPFNTQKAAKIANKRRKA